MTSQPDIGEQPTGAMGLKTPLKGALASVRRALFGVGLISIIINLLMLTGPLYMLQIYDRVLASRSAPTLIALSVLMVGLYAFMWFFDHCRARISARIGRRLEDSLSEPTFNGWLRQGAYLGDVPGQKPLTDLSQVCGFLSGLGPVAMFDLPWIPLFIGVIFLLHPLLGIVATIATLIMFIAATLNHFRTRKALQTASLHKRDSLSFAERAYGTADSLQAMGMTHAVYARWDDENHRASDASLYANDRLGGYTAFSKAFRMCVQSAVLGVGGALAISQIITPGAMIAASIIMGRALAPVQSALGVWPNFVKARQAYARLNQFFIAIDDKASALELPSPKGEILVEDVSAAPPGAVLPVLHNIDFALPAGTGMGIIGPAASGKTTLAKLLVGLWLPQTGSVRLDGATYNQWDAEKLGRHIGYLSQSVSLFDGTIGENISRFYPDATSEKIVEAAEKAGIHRVILDFDEGYDTLIGKGGRNLSGGQVQRIALARALYGRPALIVLDEPNANLDADGDAALMHALTRVKAEGATVIIITHRPGALSCVDKVLMLRDGRQIVFGDVDDVFADRARRKIESSKAAERTSPRIAYAKPQGGQSSPNFVGVKP